ncbi:hypothetical protein AB9K34_03195 [Sedimentitalea sp. XS_ASV28]|uniref:hypothetical protein n=1 Tax=Sedimentitalea sp. XS_ASV28 TaxID=3241296 RepID=UPI0035136636
MRFAIAAFLVCMVCVHPVHAGAWLREHKRIFLSFGTTIRGNRATLPDYETKFYAEYGLIPRMTLGVDVNDVRAKAAHALLFARFPIGNTEKRMRYAVEIGVGKHRQQMQWFPMYKATLAVGRGFESRWGNGWMGAELAYEVRSALPEPGLKLDLVAGLSSGPRIRPLLKLETAYVPDQPFSWSFTPGIMFDVGKSTWVLGIEGRSTTQKTIGLTFNIWRSF